MREREYGWMTGRVGQHLAGKISIGREIGEDDG